MTRGWSRIVSLGALVPGMIALQACEGLGIHDTTSLLSPNLQRSEVVGMVAGFGDHLRRPADLISMLKRRSSAGMNPRMAGIMLRLPGRLGLLRPADRFATGGHLERDRDRDQRAERRRVCLFRPGGKEARWWPLRGRAMKAITVEPKKPGTARFEDIPEPDPRDGSILVEAVARRRLRHRHRNCPTGSTAGPRPARSVSCWGTSRSAGSRPGPGRHAREGRSRVGIVRRPDPVPCPNCAVGDGTCAATAATPSAASRL